jgi:phosphopantetheinyl transferase
MQEKDSSIIIKGKNSLTIFIEEKTSISETKLFENELKTLYLIQNKQRKLEFIQVRSIRNKYFENLEIKYTSYGKPYFENSGSLFLSISHSLNYVGVITAPFDVGLDIEELHPRILRIKNKGEEL